MCVCVCNCAICYMRTTLKTMIHETLIKTYTKASFQGMCRQTSFNMLMGKATHSYDGGGWVSPSDIPTIKSSRSCGRSCDISGPCTEQSAPVATPITVNHGHMHHVKDTKEVRREILQRCRVLLLVLLLARTILLFHTISARPPKQPRMVRTFLKVHTRPRLAYALRCRGY